MGCLEGESIEVMVAAHQGEQNLPCVDSDSKGQVPQATGLLAIAIDGPFTRLEIGLEGLDEGINARIQHRAVVHVDDLMAARPVVPSLDAPVFEALEGNDRPVAIAQGGFTAQQRVHRMVEVGNAFQGIHHFLLLPVPLTSVRKMLERAATAVVGKDARGLLTIG